MKLFRNIAVAALVTLGAFSAVTYTSCTKDKCKDVTCNNGGTCSDGNCTCASGYEGTSCDSLSRTKFIKIWSATDKINTTNIVYAPVVVANTSGGITEVLISNFSDFFSSANTKATVSGNTITIARQNPSSNNYYVAGSGTIASGTITWNYTIDSSGVNTQNYTGTWR
jgi:hypothetical protein